MLFPSHVTVRRGHARFTVVQLNTLGRFDEPVPVVLDRQKTLLSYLKRVRPSILALQEVPCSSSSSGLCGEALNIADSMVAAEVDGLAYKNIHYAKPTERGDMGCLLFDTNLFELVSEECLRFAGGGSQFATVAVLRLREYPEIVRNETNVSPTTARCLLVVAQHAKAGRTDQNEAIRIEHSRQLLTYLRDPQAVHERRALGLPDVPTSVSNFSQLPSEELATLYPELLREGKLVWLGDMNAGPHSYESNGNNWPCEWYSRVVKGSANADNAEDRRDFGSWVNTEVPLLSTMTIAHRGQEPPFTTYKMRDGRLIAQTIDYILMSRGSSCLFLCGVSSPASVFESRSLPPEGFPNDEWGSDHLPLLCEIEYRQPILLEQAPASRCWRD